MDRSAGAAEFVVFNGNIGLLTIIFAYVKILIK
jgi:hypothetical protein